jgi:hypothetical protein
LKYTLIGCAAPLVALLALTGCPQDDTTTTASQTTDSTSQPSAKPNSTAPTALTVDEGTKDPAIEARAKAELDGKEPDADYKGSTLAAGKASFTSPDGWKTVSGSFTATTAKDDKARFGAGSGSDTDAAAKSLGLSDCKWNPTESISLGKDKLAADVADGLCKRGAGKAKAAYATLSAENVIAMGAWDADGGDSKPVFNAFRSAKKASGGPGAPGGLAACCAALAQNANVVPLNQKGAYLSAASVCRSAQGNPAAISMIMGALKGAKMPAVCR